jgi:peptidyl-prolyl cis-trans isomerase C
MKKFLYVVLCIVLTGVGFIAGLKCPCCAEWTKSLFGNGVKDSPIVAQVGKTEITLADLVDLKNSIPQLRTVPVEMLYDQLLAIAVNKAAVIELAKKADIADNPEIKKEMKDIRDQILARAYLDAEVAKTMTKEKLFELYQEQLQNFVPEDEVLARHILVETEEEAKDILRQLKKGADFEKMAREKSVDKASAEQGGLLEYFVKEIVVPEFGEAVFSMQKGELSDKPFKTQYGWHIVKVEDRRMKALPSFEEMEPELKALYHDKVLPEILEAEKNKIKIQTKDLKSVIGLQAEDVLVEESETEPEEVEDTEETVVEETDELQTNEDGEVLETVSETVVAE